jgi:hypothetical protein
MVRKKGATCIRRQLHNTHTTTLRHKAHHKEDKKQHDKPHLFHSLAVAFPISKRLVGTAAFSNSFHSTAITTAANAVLAIEL